MTDEQAQAAINAAFPRVAGGIRRVWWAALLDIHRRFGTTADEFVANLKKTRAESAAKERKVRTAMRQKYGTGKYRITAADEVHAYGAMPNSGQYGWYLVGSVDNVLIEIENGWL